MPQPKLALNVVLVWGLVACTALAQVAQQRSDQGPVRKGPPPTGVRSLAETGPRVPATPVKQFDQQPKMVMVQVLIVTVSFGQSKGGDGAKSTAGSAAGSVADALAKKINAEVGVERIPMSALTKELDGAIKEKVKTARIQSLTGLELTTIAGQTAFVQIGHRKPKIVGTTFSQRGRANNVSIENVGSIVQITPQVVPDGSLVVAVEIDRSDLGPEAEGMVIATTEDGTEIRSPQTDTMMAQTAVATANGQAVVVSDMICNRQPLSKETFVLLRPLVVGATDNR